MPTEKCICRPIHRPDDPICQYRPEETAPEVEWAVIRRFPGPDREYVLVDYSAEDKDDAKRVLAILEDGRKPTRYRLASRPKVQWTDAPEET